jgi:hypothetical protein
MLGGLAIALMVTAVKYTKSIPAYAMALDALRADPQAQARLGLPIEDGFSVSIKAEEDGERTEALFTIPVSGPSGSGTLYAHAHKVAERWTLDSLELEVGGDRLPIPLPPGVNTDIGPGQ